MPQLMFPDIAGATLQGFQQGQQMRANRLVGAAMQNPGDAQSYLAQAGAIDPRLALGAQGIMQQQQAQQQKAQQDQQTTTLKQLGGAARYYKAALQSGNPASVQAAKAQIAPLIMRLTGKQLPDADTPETQAALDNVIAQTAYLFPDDNKLQTITPGSVLTRGGTPVYSNPAQPKITPQGYQAVLGPDGTYHAEPIPIQGASNGMGMGPAVPGAGASTAPQAAPGFQGSATSPSGQSVTFDFPPGTPPEVIAAAKASAVANGDLAPGQQIGASQPAAPPQTLAQVVAAGKGRTGDVIQQRAQQIQELKARGVAMTPEQEQSYLMTGKAPDALVTGDNAGGMTPDATYYAAWNYNLTGKMPPFGMGGSSARVAVYNEAAKIAKDAGVSPSQMRTVQGRQHALQTSLTNLQKQSDVMERQMIAMHNNISVAENIIKQVDNGSFKSMNALKNAVKLQLGDEGVAKLNTALNAVATDYGKIMSGATGAQGASDTELQHARKLMDPTMSPSQLLGVFDVLAKDTDGQISAAHAKEAAIGELMGEFGTAGNTSPGVAPTPPPQAAPAGPTPGTIEQGYRFKGGDPSNQANWEPVQ